MTNDFAQPVVAKGGMNRGLNAISWSKICDLQGKGTLILEMIKISRVNLNQIDI